MGFHAVLCQIAIAHCPAGSCRSNGIFASLHTSDRASSTNPVGVMLTYIIPLMRLPGL